MKKTFTFQYGQIRNPPEIFIIKSVTNVYIPVWLDQKQLYLFLKTRLILGLHSSMVRLETLKKESKCENKIYVYIPVWLDQKPNLPQALASMEGLHSSMVRLETCRTSNNMSSRINVYIPVWLDQKHLFPLYIH